MALIEALVASAVLGIGMAGAMRLTLHALQTASDTRQHTVAHALAVDAMECLQSGATDCVLSDSRTVQGTTYAMQSQQQPRADLALVDLQVLVQWPAAGRTSPSTSAVSNTAAASGQRLGELMLHSSRDQVPSWVGVSSP
jgi:Tfp pilus assembly protein PilV